MIYLDVILTDEPDAIEITGKKDHKWLGLKDVLKSPKVSLWTLYRLKKFLETSYERLNSIQSEVSNLGPDVEISGGDSDGVSPSTRP